MAATLLTRERLAGLDGWVLAQPVPAGALVAFDALRAASAPEQLRAMSVPVPAERAVAGAVERGDRVDVIEVRDDTAVYIAAGVEVLAVGRPAGGPLEAGGVHTLTVAVDEDTALVLARAVEGGGVHVVRSTGSSPARVGGAAPARTQGLEAPAATDQDSLREGIQPGGD